jgi:retron-type reverse transcriptase
MEQGLRWVVDVDLSKYFDTIDHIHLRRFLDQRVTDGVVRRMIDKWLKAGGLEKGILRRTAGGTPQGGVISPLLANISAWSVRSCTGNALLASTRAISTSRSSRPSCS